MIRLTVMMYVRYPLSLRQVEDILFERGIDISHETVRFWWNRFGPMFVAEIRKRRVYRRSYSLLLWHVGRSSYGSMASNIIYSGAVDHESKVIEVLASKQRNGKAALKSLRRAISRYGSPQVIVTDCLASYGAVLKTLKIKFRQRCGRWLNNRAENLHQPF
jgi:putative transposase